MVNEESNKIWEERLTALEEKVTNLKERGGMLSGGDIRTRIICKEEVDKYLKLFERRDWDGIANRSWKQVNQSGPAGPGWEKRFVITNYNEMNVTPFSYDLSLGDQVFSIQKPKMGLVALKEEMPYPLKPGETVVVITAEKVAIPHAYSATVWPRFKMVKQGVFQSMVKIDPTWYGKLAVAMINLSPATVELKLGEAFSTLLFYELSEPSDVDLWKLEAMQKMGIEVVEEIPKEFKGDIDKIDNHIFSSKELRGYCYVRDQSIVAWGIKREQVEALKDYFADERWCDSVDRLAKKWTNKLHANGKRMIVMPALGMENLWDIVKGLKDEGYIKEEDIRGMTLESNDALISAAMKYGEPFDIFARIPDTIVKRIEDETIPKIEAEIQSKIQTRVIVLVFSLFGFISLVLTILVMLWRLGGKDFLEKFSNWPGLYAVLTIGGAVFGLGFLSVGLIWIRSVKRGVGRVRSNLDKQRLEIEQRKEEFEKRREAWSRKERKWENKQAVNMKKFKKSMKKLLSKSKSKKDKQGEVGDDEGMI